MYDHLLDNGIIRNYVRWLMHGIYEFYKPTNTGNSGTNESDMHDEMEEMLNDVFRMSMPNEESERSPHVHEEFELIPNENANKFYNLLRNVEHELYPGCKNFTKLSFIIRLFQMKCLNEWSNKSFTMLLELLKETLPEGETLPSNYYETKKVIRELGLHYNKIDACPSNYMLYSKEHANANKCIMCGALRWKSSNVHHTDEFNQSSKKKKIHAKVLRYFPLKPRLQRLYMSSKTTSHMKWHVDGCMRGEMMRHLVESLAWKNFDKVHPSFAQEPRNVKLDLASDGLNPFGNMSISYTCGLWFLFHITYHLVCI